MNGTWKVTGTAGGGGGLAVATALAAVMGIEWVFAHLLWILGTGVLCAVLTAVAVARLARWSDERAVRVWAQRPAQLRAEVVTEVPPAQQPAIASHYHVHYHAADGQQAPAITEGK